jgi:hypothetical protein
MPVPGRARIERWKLFGSRGFPPPRPGQGSPGWVRNRYRGAPAVPSGAGRQFQQLNVFEVRRFGDFGRHSVLAQYPHGHFPQVHRASAS